MSCSLLPIALLKLLKSLRSESVHEKAADQRFYGSDAGHATKWTKLSGNPIPMRLYRQRLDEYVISFYQLHCWSSCKNSEMNYYIRRLLFDVILAILVEKQQKYDQFAWKPRADVPLHSTVPWMHYSLHQFKELSCWKQSEIDSSIGRLFTDAISAILLETRRNGPVCIKIIFRWAAIPPIVGWFSHCLSPSHVRIRGKWSEMNPSTKKPKGRDLSLGWSWEGTKRRTKFRENPLLLMICYCQLLDCSVPSVSTLHYTSGLVSIVWKESADDKVCELISFGSVVGETIESTKFLWNTNHYSWNVG